MSELLVEPPGRLQARSANEATHERSSKPAALLSCGGLGKSFARGRRWFARARPVRAVDNVTLSAYRGETLAIVGESGCGKSTLARLLLGLIEPSEGEVWFDGQRLADLSAERWRDLRRAMQLVFQDTGGAFDPRLPVRAQIREPLEIHSVGTSEERTARVTALLNAVRLPEHLWDAIPQELSGGQLQRAIIARALVLDPRLLVCDEPVSALDVSVQAQILNLLMDLKAQFGLTLIFISHDLNVVRHVADRVAVMYLGAVVEQGPADRVFGTPAHPYTKALLSAIPLPDPTQRGRRLRLAGDPPDPARPPAGCRFHPRCPAATEVCSRTAPPPRRDGSHLVACHHPQAGA